MDLLGGVLLTLGLMALLGKLNRIELAILERPPTVPPGRLGVPRGCALDRAAARLDAEQERPAPLDTHINDSDGVSGPMPPRDDPDWIIVANLQDE